MSFYSAEHAMSYTEMALLRLSVMVGRRDEQLEKWCWRSEVGAATEAPEEGVALRRRRWSEREHRATQCPATWPFLDENAVVLSLDFESFMHLFFNAVLCGFSPVSCFGSCILMSCHMVLLALPCTKGLEEDVRSYLRPFACHVAHPCLETVLKCMARWFGSQAGGGHVWPFHDRGRARTSVAGAHVLMAWKTF